MIDLKSTKTGKENVTASAVNEDLDDNNVIGFVQKKVKKAPSFDKGFFLDTGASNG